jgi:hypothetical protein
VRLVASIISAIGKLFMEFHLYELVSGTREHRSSFRKVLRIQFSLGSRTGYSADPVMQRRLHCRTGLEGAEHMDGGDGLGC